MLGVRVEVGGLILEGCLIELSDVKSDRSIAIIKDECIFELFTLFKMNIYIICINH